MNEGKFFEVVRQEVGPSEEAHEWRDATPLVAAADHLAEAVPEGEESADGRGVRLTWDEYQTLIRALADYRRIREGREG